MNYKKGVIADILGVINSPRIPLEEHYYDCDNYKEYLSNEHFHHSEKGCEVEIRRTSNVQRDNRISINRYCKTHDCLCSKTGWELGWFSGTNNRIYKNNNVKKKCHNCNEWYMTTSGNTKYCRECAIIIGRDNYAIKHISDVNEKLLPSLK